MFKDEEEENAYFRRIFEIRAMNLPHPEVTASLVVASKDPSLQNLEKLELEVARALKRPWDRLCVPTGI
ncbi:hypothetical protein [Nannocystis pusilla]|uniref:hypothetical protein n=1 Tax=Nannocystis pusilla TaxID=889268 RepID=UPI003DA55B95